MPNASRSRTIAAPALQLWEVISDPHHLPRWWPRVTRVEAVEDGAFTEVMKTRKGKFVRADFQLIESDEDARRIRWEQRVQGTPFERVLKSAETEVRLQPGSAQATSTAETTEATSTAEVTETTEVTIELRQALNGFFPRFGGYMVRRAAEATLDEALDGLERIGG